MLEKIYNAGIPYLVCCRKGILGEDWFLCVFTDQRPDKSFKISMFHDCVCEANLSHTDVYFFRTHKSLFTRHEKEPGIVFFEDKRFDFKSLFIEKSVNFKRLTGINYGSIYRPRVQKVA